MAHVTASLNRLHEPQILTAETVRNRTTKPPNAATDSGTSTSGTSNTGESDFQALFGGQTNPQATAPTATAAPAAPAPAPTPESVFGESPWISNPLGTNPNGTTFSYNPWYFATPQAAAQVAQMLGGSVVASNEFTAPGSPFVQQQPNLMVQMPNGSLVNAGLVASFYAHGYPQSYINTLIDNEINGTNV
jgi:hypothetical protein